MNIASIPSRKNELIKTLDSITNQVDEVRVALNGYKHLPQGYHKYNNVIFLIRDNSNGDAEKFRWVEETDGYYLTGDDDLIYPPTYVKDMIKALEKYDVVTLHGRSFHYYPIKSYYKNPDVKVSCLNESLNDTIVQFGGTGVMAFHTKDFKPPFDIFKRANCADIWIGLYSDSVGVDICALKHIQNYLTYQQVPNTIWLDKNDDCQYETNIVNEYFF